MDRWATDYNFNIRYRPGKANVDADTLSRMSLNMEVYMTSCSEETTQQVLQDIMYLNTRESSFGQYPNWWTWSIY
jgi:hypothetical protein